ncbi:hemerythrin domain-containing protein [Microbacterium oryzae]|uniref:hemerythrin domain-containing protein n=1 Tax=Microbacterium oryzae TaxID=743009 RepID=UPI0025AF3A50|nr:hemerythrin domain-containing protein [Microbacterium oryzae]MDN3311426.1 hemerythrin domain-containing protein [Microbacterium oryzae]
MASGGEKARFVAWAGELRAVHERLRDALRVTREAVEADGRTAEGATRELLLFCHGFCAALAAHHRAEDRTLFPAIASEHPELRDTIRKLEQDHSMIAHLLGGLQEAVDHGQSPSELLRHLEGVAAIMESHFGYEERQLLAVLRTLALDAPVEDALGPF